MHKFYSNLSGRGKIIFQVALVVVIVSLFDRLFWGPLLAKEEETLLKIKQAKERVVRDNRILAYKTQILNEAMALQEYYSDIKEEDLINRDFLGTIERLSTKTGINLVKSTPGVSEEKKGYKEYSANLELNGSLSDVLTFMYEIGTVDSLLKVEELALNPRRGLDDEVSATMRVSKMVVEPPLPTLKAPSNP